MDKTANARRLRREQTDEEKSLWRALRAGRFAGFKFRRQHPLGVYCLDFYCPAAKLSVELDGFHHGMPDQRLRDEERVKVLAAHGIEELRFWNRQWRENRDGVLLEIWNELHRRTGCVAVMRKLENHRFVPPKPKRLIQGASSPRPSPPSDGGEGAGAGGRPIPKASSLPEARTSEFDPTFQEARSSTPASSPREARVGRGPRRGASPP